MSLFVHHPSFRIHRQTTLGVKKGTTYLDSVIGRLKHRFFLEIPAKGIFAFPEMKILDILECPLQIGFWKGRDFRKFFQIMSRTDCPHLIRISVILKL